MREFLDKAIKADQCAQYVDDIGIAANDSTRMCINIKTVFECIRKAGLKLTMAKCHFGITQVDFLGRTITPEGVSPQTEKVKQFLQKLKLPKSKKLFKGTLGFSTTIETIYLVCQKSSLAFLQTAQKIIAILHTKHGIGYFQRTEPTTGNIMQSCTQTTHQKQTTHPHD